MRILYNHRPSWWLWIVDILSSCTSISSPVPDECKKIWSVVDMLRRNQHWLSPIISSIYGLKLERRIFLFMALQSFVGPWPLFSFLILYTDGRTPWTSDQPFARPLPTHRRTQTQNKRTQYRHPCFEWDSKPLSQPSRERREFML
jgi:hypothetical protein